MAPSGDANPIPQPPTQFSWIYAEEELSAAALTVRAQTASPNDNGRLLWDIFFPRQDVDSTKLEDITRTDFRPASDRRGWNKRGRRIPLLTPTKRKLEIEPIEANYRIDEKEMNDLISRFKGNEQMIRAEIRANIPQRTDDLAISNFRRLELDSLQAWYDGIVTVRDPESNGAYDVSFDFASERLEEASTIWTDAGVNAYNEFTAWLNDALALIGPLRGVVIRQAARNAIWTDAPTLPGGIKMSLGDLQRRISEDIQSEFAFFLLEDTVDVFPDGGIKTERRNKWKPNKIAAIPSDNRIGVAAFAPVARAITLNAAVPQAEIDVRGNSVFPSEENNGRELDVECQLNAFPVPDENRVAVMDTLIGA